MSALLDRTNPWGDRNGDVSDPRLINKIGRVTRNTPEEYAAVRRSIENTFPDDTEDHQEARAELIDMFGWAERYWEERTAA